ncbi:methyltransferase family protein [Leifsonia sp. NPDC058194]|uniref:methyltransferase family protein n=1 Tax=Leifsonia sp. NPDC058194 TaxID=3346374 RepID=UPI0036DA1E9F
MGVSFAVPRRWGRAYFALQAAAGGAWWIAVFLSPPVRNATLGGLEPLVVAVLDIPLFVVSSAVAAFGSRVAAVVATGWTILVTVGLGVYATVTGAAGWGVLLMLAASGLSVLALCSVVLGRLPAEWVVSGPFRFRPATARRSAAAHVVATFAQIAAFWGFFLAALPAVIAFLEERWGFHMSFPPGAVVTGLVVLALASALGIWSGAIMSALGDGTPLPAAMPNLLVVAGPYRWVRNPMALAGIVQAVAVGLVLQSWMVVVYALIGSLVWNLLVRPFEEADLEQRFGAEFARYRANVRCWIPRILPWTPATESLQSA